MQMQTSTYLPKACISPVWMDLEKSKSCFHEAGHAVIARLVDFPVAWVSVDHKFIDSAPLAIESRITGIGPVCMTISSGRMQSIIDARKALTKADKEVVVGYVMHVLAGPFAEHKFDPSSFSKYHSENDFGQVSAILWKLEPKKAGRTKLATSAQRRLRKCVDENWDLIARVAGELREYGTLLGCELDKIINRADMKAAA